MNNTGDPRQPLMSVDGLSRRFGGIVALKDVSFSLANREKLAIIGPNGAGKSTLLKLIAGQDRPSGGHIMLEGEGEVQGKPAHHLTSAGVALARQIPRPLRSLTIRENIVVGIPAGDSRSSTSRHDRIDEILELTSLAPEQNRLAGTLPLLDLKRLEVARAMASNPRVLLLDEVSAGLNESELDVAIELIRLINSTGTALLIVEHVQRVIHELADRVLVLNWGEKLMEGTPAEVTADEEVRRIYLGGGRRPSAAKEVATPQRVTESVSAGRNNDGLEICDLTVRRGSLLALDRVTFTIRPGEVVAVLGSNGAGKTTLTQSVSGLLGAESGTIRWQGMDITQLPAHKRAKLGISHCQEGRKLFPGMSVRQNLELGAFGARRLIISQRVEEVFDAFPVLRERQNQIATTMSGGQQQMLAIGRALMAKPQLILFDEVTLGLSPKVADDIYESFGAVTAMGVSLLLVEQDAERCLSIASRAYVLGRGRILHERNASEITDELLVSAYLAGAPEKST
jgi:ABC-type branched-subunit amino acid transport system ATPase component